MYTREVSAGQDPDLIRRRVSGQADVADVTSIIHAQHIIQHIVFRMGFRNIFFAIKTGAAPLLPCYSS